MKRFSLGKTTVVRDDAGSKGMTFTRRSKAGAGALGVVSLALLPALGAIFQLGAELDAFERMRHADDGPSTVESIATYEVDPETNEAQMRFHSVLVRR